MDNRGKVGEEVISVCGTNLLKTLWEKEKNACPTAFSTRLENILPFSLDLKLSFANSLCLEEFKFVVWEGFKYTPNDRILDWSKFRASDDNLNMVKIVLDRLEYIVGLRVFQKASASWSFKLKTEWKRGE